MGEQIVLVSHNCGGVLSEWQAQICFLLFFVKMLCALSHTSKVLKVVKHIWKNGKRR